MTLDHFTRAVERIVAGLERRNRVLNANEHRTVAYDKALAVLARERALLDKETLAAAELDAFRRAIAPPAVSAGR